MYCLLVIVNPPLPPVTTTLSPGTAAKLIGAVAVPELETVTDSL
jgi:hypothetical protein